MRLIIANSDDKYCELLKKVFLENDSIDVVGVACDGNEAIKIVSEVEADVILVDYVMPGIDGLEILKSISDIMVKNKPAVIMLSSLSTDIAVRQAEKLGACYFIVRPFDTCVLCQRIIEIYEDKCDDKKLKTISEKYIINETPSKYFTEADMHNNENNIELCISSIMRDMLIPSHLMGNNYIKLAIIQAIKLRKRDYPNETILFTRDIYPYVAELVGKTCKHIQQNIRNTIVSAWKRGGQDCINSIFGYTVNYAKGRPTNSEFISMVTDKILIQESVLK